MDKLKIDIKMFMIIALGSNDYLQPTIGKIYKKNKIEYFNAYKNSNYYNNEMFNGYTTINSQYIKKVAGIVQHGYTNKNKDNIYSLINKGYKYPWRYVKGRTFVDTDTFLGHFLKRMGGIEETSELLMLYNMIILVYVCEDKGIEYSTNNVFGQTFQQGLFSLIKNASINEHYFSKDIIDANREEIDKLYKEFDISREDIKTDLLLDGLIYPESSEDDNFNRDISNYVGVYAGLIKTLGINEIDLTSSVLLSVDDIDRIFMHYIYCKEDNLLKEENKKQFIIDSIFFVTLGKEYKRTKDKYLEEERESFMSEIENIRRELQLEKEELNIKKIEFESRRKEIGRENRNLKKNIEKTEEERNKYKMKLESKEDNTKELHSLREYIFALEQEEIEKETIEEVNNKLKVIQNKKAAIVGGHINWVNKMKEILPGYTFISPDSLSIDLKFMDNLDAVFVNIDNNRHAFYNKLMQQMNKNDTELHFISNVSNTDRTVKQIYNAFYK